MAADAGTGEPGIGPGLRAEGADDGAPGVSREGPREGAGHDHERVGRIKGIYRLGVFIPDNPGGEAPGPQVVGHHGGRLGGPDAAAAEVHAQDTVGPPMQAREARHASDGRMHGKNLPHWTDTDDSIIGRGRQGGLALRPTLCQRRRRKGKAMPRRIPTGRRRETMSP